MVVVFELRMMLGAFGAGERVANRIKKSGRTLLLTRSLGFREFRKVKQRKRMKIKSVLAFEQSPVMS